MLEEIIKSAKGLVLGLSLASCTQLYIPKEPHYDLLGQRIDVVFQKEVFLEVPPFPGENLKPGEKKFIRTPSKSKYVDGRPTIYMGENYLSTLPQEAQIFIFYHEIGHFHKNHFNLNLSISTEEREADCYSAKFLRDNFHYPYSRRENSFNFLRQNVPGGNERYGDLKKCLEEK